MLIGIQKHVNVQQYEFITMLFVFTFVHWELLPLLHVLDNFEQITQTSWVPYTNQWIYSEANTKEGWKHPSFCFQKALFTSFLKLCKIKVEFPAYDPPFRRSCAPVLVRTWQWPRLLSDTTPMREMFFFRVDRKTRSDQTLPRQREACFHCQGIGQQVWQVTCESYCGRCS